MAHPCKSTRGTTLGALLTIVRAAARKIPFSGQRRLELRETRLAIG